MVLAQIGLGSPHLLFDYIQPHLMQQILKQMSDMLEATSPAEIRQYDSLLWSTFLPFWRYLYKPSRMNIVTAKSLVSDGEDIKTKLYINYCNVLLYGLETVFGRYVDQHLEVLIKEGLLDFTMCL